MQAAVKGKNPKPDKICCDVPRPGSSRGPSPGCSLSRRVFCPQGRPGPRQDGKESGRIQRQNSKREPILTRSPPLMGQAPPKAKPKDCCDVLRPGSSSGFLFNSSIHGAKGGKTFAGTSCALAPFQNSFARLLSKGTKKLLACPVPWLLFKIPFSSSFPKRQEHCWRVLCPGSFSGFLFKAPFQRGKNIAGASCALAPFQDSFSKPQENCWRVLSFLSKSWASLLALPHCRSLPYRSKRNISHGPPPGHHKPDFRN